MFAFHYLKAFEFIVSVHNQLCLVSIHSNQDHVLWIILYVATNKLIGGSICKELVAEKKHPQNFFFFYIKIGLYSSKVGTTLQGLLSLLSLKICNYIEKTYLIKHQNLDTYIDIYFVLRGYVKNNSS